VNNSRPDLDPFAGFDADDEFANPTETDWSAAPPAEPEAALDPTPAFEDPFDLGAPSIESAEAALHSELSSPSGPLEASAAPANPIGDMQAGLEASMAIAGVPRIAIHVFYERPETAEAAEQAMEDRRMARATGQVLPGGLAAAVAHYQNQATPPLVVVESLDGGGRLLGLLDQLAEVCDPGTKVMVLGAANDIQLYRELMSRGVSEYLVPPLDPIQFINAIATLYADPSAPFLGRSIAVVGAKGGVGASTLAHNLAYAFAERLMANTVIVDFDLPFGTAGLDFNQDPLHGVANALHQPDRLDPVLLERMMAKCSERLSLFAAPATLDDDYEIAADAYEEVASKIRTTASFVVLDLPHLWSPWMRRMLLGVDELVIVATPDLASLRNAKNMIDLLRAARPNDTPPRLVLNQVGVQGRPEIPVKDFGEALALPPSLCLPFDPKLFGQAANNGEMLEVVNAKSRAAEGIVQLAQLIGRREAAAPVKTSILSSLFKRK
jgi:pilus assembly protein CpaE